MALRALANRPRSEAEIRTRLARAELGAEADDTVAWLARLGYLDDAAFARARARGLVSGGRAGPRLDERRLRAAGIPEAAARQAIRDALQEVTGAAGGEAEVALCRAFAERRTRGATLASLDDKPRARLARWLLGRGFAGPVVARVIGTFDDSEV
jgi:regulatory protein